MKMLNKALLSSLSIALSMVSFGAYAQEAAVQEDTTKPRAVLFKVHDIQPVENVEGAITECNFLVTFYNRTTDSLRDAKVEMGWTDTITDRYVTEDGSDQTGEVTQVNRNSQRNKQERLGEFTTSVEVPALGAYKQATVKGRVKTEKCFLLLDNLEFKVSACNIIGKTDNTSNNNNNRRSRVTANRSASECSNLFQYVDSKNPEYYDEFKNISYSEQERLLSNDKAQDTTEIDSSYETIIKNFEKAESVMSNIK